MSPLKPIGIARIVKAAGYSLAGLKAAFVHETAFRQEISILAIGVPAALYFGKTNVERAVMISSLLVVLITELLNSALEAAVDRIGLERHPLAGRAKDLGSAAVFVSIVLVVVIWSLVL
ncbi:MAG: diacylglycerol kinase [Desulfobacterium sp.]|jgi:diacylglycerol kinase (ATP)|nr:diacylglycerol kinase [Desulfobacterium sp.]